MKFYSYDLYHLTGDIFYTEYMQWSKQYGMHHASREIYWYMGISLDNICLLQTTSIT